MKIPIIAIFKSMANFTKKFIYSDYMFRPINIEQLTFILAKWIK